MVCMPWNVPELVQQVKRQLFWWPLEAAKPVRKVAPVKQHAASLCEERYDPNNDDYDVRSAVIQPVAMDQVLRGKQRQINALLHRVEAGGDQQMLNHYLQVARELYDELQELEDDYAKEKELWAETSCMSESTCSSFDTEEGRSRSSSEDFVDLSRPRSDSILDDEWTMLE
mmetsp:Transcript_62751/g.99418  ORF Transcript_62751/g.99418 Transcript_62751/m.99418 type:complete len:171 (+) Transcript_62751:121-633(+)